MGGAVSSTEVRIPPSHMPQPTHLFCAVQGCHTVEAGIPQHGAIILQGASKHNGKTSANVAAPAVWQVSDQGRGSANPTSRSSTCPDPGSISLTHLDAVQVVAALLNVGSKALRRPLALRFAIVGDEQAAARPQHAEQPAGVGRKGRRRRGGHVNNDASQAGRSET